MKGSLMSSEVAEPYAQALMSVAQEHNLSEDFGQQFRDLEGLLEESAELREFIANPVIDPEAKKAVISRVMGEDANPFLINFLRLLVDKRRIVFLEQIAQQYLALLREMNQTVLAEVTSVAPLSEEQTGQIKERVKGMTGAREVEIKTTINSALIGGVIIKAGSQVIDSSIRGQLRRIGNSLGRSN